MHLRYISCIKGERKKEKDKFKQKKIRRKEQFGRSIESFFFLTFFNFTSEKIRKFV